MTHLCGSLLLGIHLHSPDLEHHQHLARNMLNVSFNASYRRLLGRALLQGCIARSRADQLLCPKHPALITMLVSSLLPTLLPFIPIFL
jgi:hypothetical protein